MPTCPQCHANLIETDTPAGPAPACKDCGHLFVTADQLDEMQARIERRYTPDDVQALHDECGARKRAAVDRPVVYVRCPECQEPMARRTFGRASFVLVHVCTSHGSWLHGDALNDIADYIRRGGELIEWRHAHERLEDQLEQAERGRSRAEQRAHAAGDGTSSMIGMF